MPNNALAYIVECKSSYPFFEKIAAFNCDLAAIRYAQECKSTNPELEYRVKGPGWIKPIINEVEA